MATKPQASNHSAAVNSDTKMHALSQYIEQHHNHRLTLQLLASHVNMSASHLQKRFSKAMGMSPKKYQEAYRLKHFKRALKAGHAVTDAVYEAGYESSSRIYGKLDAHIGMTPGNYRKGGSNESISYAADQTPIGKVMIAANDRGICFLQFGSSKRELLAQLKIEFPNANYSAMPENARLAFNGWMQKLNSFITGKSQQLDLPLDIHGTAFQRIVWDYLTSIPSGTLQSYTQVAQGIGKPAAARAVASACANNKIAIAIPCHRVIRGDGSLAGYKWGIKRKQHLIALEQQ